MIRKFAEKVTQQVGREFTLPRLSVRTFLTQRGEDPWVIFWEGSYYYCREYDDRMIIIGKSARLEDIGKQGHIVWEDPVGTPEAELWAPELHRVNGKWYIYFAAGKDETHRMYVLEGTSDDPQGTYVMKAKISDPSDLWAIDGTVFEWKNKWYYLWSGGPSATDKTQNLYIAALANPWTVTGKRICISSPGFDWEKIGAPDWPHINEGPQALEHNGELFIIYSASHSLTDDYCLGRLTLIGDNPLQPGSWLKEPKPVFRKSGSVFGPGHASFIEKPDGSNWIIYHSTSKSNAGWDARLLRAQQFSWKSDGSPDFGKPRTFKEVKILERFIKITLSKLR